MSIFVPTIRVAVAALIWVEVNLVLFGIWRIGVHRGYLLGFF